MQCIFSYYDLNVIVYYKNELIKSSYIYCSVLQCLFSLSHFSESYGDLVSPVYHFFILWCVVVLAHCAYVCSPPHI